MKQKTFYAVICVSLVGCSGAPASSDTASATATTGSSSYAMTSASSTPKTRDAITVSATDSVIHTGGDMKLRLDSVIHTGGDVRTYLTAAGDDVMVGGSSAVKCQYSVEWTQPTGGGKRRDATVACVPRDRGKGRK